MITSQGIGVDSWVMMDGDCAVSCEVVGDQAQFMFGHGTGSLHLIATEDALATLVGVAAEALRGFRAVPVGGEVCFAVTAPA